jgi:uncharacterized protein (DUF1684 family)
MEVASSQKGGRAVEISHPYVDLLDYRRSVAGIYAAVRQGAHEPAESWRAFRAGRDALFRAHPQSALSDAQKHSFAGLRYYDYDPALRFLLPLDTAVEPEVFEIALEHDGVVRIQRFGRVHFQAGGQALALSLFWVMGYGGGVFLPFRDQTNSRGSYGGGRYLLDTIKHADLGQIGGRLVIDFNFAYNPSCAYNSRWQCPLAPAENRLPAAIPAGERDFAAEGGDLIEL